MTLSLVICTRNRAQQLARALESLLVLEYSEPWQLVLVDNGSTDDTQAVIKSFRTRFNQDLVSVTETRRGTGAARNRGWQSATHDIVIYIDDDCYPSPDFLMAMRTCFDADERIGVVAGRILLHDPADYPLTLRPQTAREHYAPGQFIEVGLFQTANCAFRRRALEAAHGFDVRFGAGALFPGEDADIVSRISADGWHAVFDPSPLVYHHHGRRAPDDISRQMALYDRGRGAVYAKCGLDPRLRSTYLRHWYWLMRIQPVAQTRRELLAAAEFLVRHAVGQRAAR
jgi:glycosyltransferase involved in cell wall biosynthesis